MTETTTERTLAAGPMPGRVARNIYTRETMAAMDVDDVALAARVRASVLITGGSSADREACARFIHASGPAAKGPFVPLRTLAVTWPIEQDAEALRHHFELARGGTLLIDDLVFLTPAAQCELLWILKEHGPCGPVRIISGTGDGTGGERAAAYFDDRLFYRLNLIRIDLGAAAARQSLHRP